MQFRKCHRFIIESEAKLPGWWRLVTRRTERNIVLLFVCILKLNFLNKAFITLQLKSQQDSMKKQEEAFCHPRLLVFRLLKQFFGCRTKTSGFHDRDRDCSKHFSQLHAILSSQCREIIVSPDQNYFCQISKILFGHSIQTKIEFISGSTGFVQKYKTIFSPCLL